LGILGKNIVFVEQRKRVAFHTIGCKLNYSETSSLARAMESEGFLKTDFETDADIYVINTCSVTENANKDCRALVRRIKKRVPDAAVVITGCYAQLKPQEIAAITGVDLVLGAAEKFNLPFHLKELTKNDSGIAKICSCDIDSVTGFHSSYSAGDRTRSFLKVQDGCDYNCSFCTIPLARGNSRSDSIDGVLQNMALLAAEGIKEIVLTGVNLGDFGKGAEGGKKHESNFLELIQAMDAQQGIERIRISSIEPNLLTQEIIEFVSTSRKFMPHFHVPLQSGSNKILGLMRRRYVRELYQNRVNTIKNVMPHCCIGADVIVGFPTETDEDFNDTFQFLHSLDVSYLHVFTYSERENTPAIQMKPAVPVAVRNERNAILRNLSYQKSQYFRSRHVGTLRPVLFEHENRNGLMEGFTDNYIKVQTGFNQALANNITDWKID
jgi:threonylcarbamoyladenosine tRNA methylthiotransferase MtaB